MSMSEEKKLQDKIVLFVDFDNGGALLVNKIIASLEGKGVKIDSFIWNQVAS